MDQANTHIDAFHKLKLGWVRPRLVLRSGSYEVRDVETRHEILALVDPDRGLDEYYLVENRWPGSSYDTTMGAAGGLAVWHVMEAEETWRNVAAPPNVDDATWNGVRTAGNARALMMLRLIRPVLGAPYDLTESFWNGARPETGYDLGSSPVLGSGRATMDWGDGSSTGSAIRRIPGAGASMSVAITVP